LGKDNRTGFLAREIPRATLAHKDLVCFVPILDGRHWSLAVLELQKQRISILDFLKMDRERRNMIKSLVRLFFQQ
jgi:Ulp1 family protease